MVCDRCKKVLTKAFQHIGLEVSEIQLGSITLHGTAALHSTDPIRQVLQVNGFELLQDRTTTIISEIKRLIAEVFEQATEFDERFKFSRFLTGKFPLAYDTLSALFSSHEGITLEKYIINKRLEKVKELLVYSDYTLTDIAYRTGYSNIYHLSNQFKEHTGLSPSHFREVKASKEKLADSQKRQTA